MSKRKVCNNYKWSGIGDLCKTCHELRSEHIIPIDRYNLGINQTKVNMRATIDSLIQEIKQDPTISISQRNYAIKKMEELASKL